MSYDANFTPVLRPDLLRQDIDHEAVVWSPERRDPVALDPVATVMLAVIDGSATIADLVDDVHDVVGVAHELAEAQVQRTVSQLDHAGALITSEASSIIERQRELFINPPST